jgi:HK97 family phage major capsid protein
MKAFKYFSIIILVLIGVGFASMGAESLLTGFATMAVALPVWIVDGKFKELSKEEIEKLDVEDMAKYYNAENENYRKSIKKLIEEKADSDLINQLKSEFAEMKDNQMKALNSALESQGLMIQKLRKDINGTTEVKSVYTSIKEQLSKHIETLGKLKSGERERIELNVKAPATITSANISGGNVPVEQREPGFTLVPKRRTWIMDIITRGQATSNIISWVEQANIDGGAGGTAEGDVKNQMDFDIEVRNEALVKRTVYIKVSEEMLEDVDFLSSEINNELLRTLSLDIDNQLLTGNGTAPNLTGLLSVATSWSAGSFANAVDEANNWDVLRTAINQVSIAHFEPNVILMHPSDVTAMGLTKGADGHYVMPPFQSAEGKMVTGVRILENTGMTIDNFLVMDSTRATAFWKDNIRIEVGWVNDDFVRNLRTVLAEARLLQRVRKNDAGAFVTGTFTAAKAALETP